jgi:DNA-binding NarL/FixJ family response regulator
MKFLVVDDHTLIREALRGVLAELCADAVVLEAPSCQQALNLVREHPDLSLIILDLQLPDCDGFEMLTELRKNYPAISIVILSAFNDRENVVRALDSGALGFIPKTEVREVLLNALRLVLAGGIYIPANVLGPVRPSPLLTSAARKPASPMPTRAVLGLTERQVEVLALIMQGKSNKLICRALGLAEPTVKNHVSAILKALEVTNRTEAVLTVAASSWELHKLVHQGRNEWELA